MCACAVTTAFFSDTTPASNDDIASPRVLYDGAGLFLTGNLLGSLAEATVEPSEPAGVSSVWYTWTAPAYLGTAAPGCTLTFDTQQLTAAPTDTTVSVFTLPDGGAMGDLVAVPGTTTTCSTATAPAVNCVRVPSVTLSAGTVYYVRVAELTAQPGASTHSLRWDLGTT
jgi:hypothetical protein